MTTTGSQASPPPVPKKSAEALRLRSLGLSNKQAAGVLGVPVDSYRRLVSEESRRLNRATTTVSAASELGLGQQKPKFLRARATAVGDKIGPTELWGGPPWEKLTDIPAKPAASGPTYYAKLDGMPMRGNDLHGGIGFGRRGVSFKKPTHLVIPDTQVRPGVPIDHLLWAGKYIAERQPDVVVHLGDHWDFPSLSSYESRGAKWFEGKRLREDIDAGNRALDLLMEGMGSFRPKRMVMLRGNHEDRLTRAINETPTLLEGLVGFEDLNDTKHGWEVIPYLKPIEIDGLAYAHYFYNPNNGRAYSGNVDTMLRNIGHSFVMGHQQGLRNGRRELASGHTQRGLVAGSFYQHSEEYRGPQAAFEWRGILVLHEVGGGTYDLMEVSLDYLRRHFA